MEMNIGVVDRMMRIIIGVAVFSLFFVVDGGVRWVGLIGLVTIVTGFIGVCPAYALFGMSTLEDGEHGQEPDLTHPLERGYTHPKP